MNVLDEMEIPKRRFIRLWLEAEAKPLMTEMLEEG